MFRRSPPRLSSLALFAAQLLGLAGLYAADRAITHGARTRVELDAAETAAFAEALLASHVQTLRTMRGVLGDSSGPPYQRRVSALVEDLVEGRLLFRRVWMSDSAGVVRYERLFGATGPVLGPGLDIDTAAALQLRATTAVVRQTREAAISTAGRILTGERGFSIVVPLVVGDRIAGFAGGTLTAGSLLRELARRRPLEGAGVAIVAREDTVAAQNANMAGERTRYVAVNTFHVPGGAEWEVSVARPARDTLARVAMWTIGLAMIGALSLALVRERREGRRVAERSTELERLSAELLRANRAKSEFLANVSHELRTPLNAIVGFVDLLRDGVYGALNSRQVGPVERIEASANHLRHLVDQVLDLAKMAAGRLEVHTEPLELRPFVFDVASEVEPLVTEKGLSFSLTVGATLPRVRTDPTHLRQILINLLGNAVKFTTAGSISVRGKLVGNETRAGLPSVLNAATALLLRSPRPDGLWIALQVVDSGIGIAEQDRERIFDEFEQVNAGPRGDSMRRGTGLGLSISRRLARLIGGDITVESELGRGSVFTIWLPVDPADLRGDRAA